jgi:hypothetical protein
MNNIAGNKTDMGNQNLGFQKSNGSTARISNWFLKFSMVALFILMIGETSWGQVNGDYQTRAAGNWNANTTWQVRSGGAWVNCAVGDYPGVAAGAGTVTILNSHNVTLNVSPANAIGALTINNGATNTSVTFSGANSLTVTGATTINGSGTNGINKFIDVAAGTFSTGSVSMTDGGAASRDCYISISTGSLTVSGTITMAGANDRNYLLFSGAGTAFVGGTITGGTITSTAGGGAAAPTSGTVDYNGAGAQNVGNYTYFNLATSTGGIKTLPAANINITGTLSVNSSTLAFNAAAARTIAVTGNLSGDGTIDMSSGSRTHILNLGGATNSIGTLTTAAVASVINYNRAGDQTIFGSANYRNLTISGGSNKSLQASVTMGGTLTMTLGKIILGTNDLTLTSATAIGTPTATSHIVADGAGQLKKVFAAGATAAYTLPIGDASGDYTPVVLTYAANSIQRTIGVRVTDAQHPSDGTATDYISRYWSFTDDQAGTYTYSASFTYSTTLPSDLVGAYANLRVNRWDGSVWTQYTTTGAAPTLTVTNETQASSPLNNVDFTARVNGPVTYTWNQIGATASWATPTSWTPTRFSPQPTDILIFDNAGTTIATNVPSQTIAKLTLLNNSDVSLQSAAVAQTLTIAGAAGTDLDIPVGSTLQLSSTGANQIGIAFTAGTTATIDGSFIINANTALTNSLTTTNSTTTVNGTISNSGVITSTAANLTFNAAATYNHTRDAGAIPTATWDATSNCNITGITASAFTNGLNQTFGNLTFNCALLTGARIATLAGNTVVQGDFNMTGTSAANTITLQLAGLNFTVNGTTNINGYGIINDNALAGTNLFIGLVTINANGQWVTTTNPPFTFRGGLAYNGSAFTSGPGNYTFNTNDQTISGGQSITITNIVTTGITLTNTNTAELIVSTLTGTGSFTNGDASNEAILKLAASNPAITGTLDFSSNPNTVNYSGGAGQVIGAYNFYNLTSSNGAVARTLVNGGTIGIKGTFTPGTNVYTTTNNTINFNGTAAQTIPALPSAGIYNNITISGGSTKTLTGNAIISGVLNLNTGILECDAFNLNLNSTATVTGTFSSSNMIATNGIGYLQRNAATAAGFQILYPIGSGGFYSPMTISNIGTIIPANIKVRAVPTAINPSYIKKYWDVQSNVALNNVTATFEYEAGELNGALPSISYSPDAGVTWQNPPSSGASSFGGNSFTITGNTPFTGSGAPFRGYWTMGYRTFYSYQTGSWDTPTTWTSDPSGSLQIGSTIPGYNDKVVILPGRTVSLASDIAVANIDITIEDGGFLNLGTYRFTNLPTNLLGLRGQGTLQLATVNFPTATTNTLVGATGGTVEYNNTANFTLPTTQTIYHDLVINTTAGVIATEMNNLTLSGNLYIKQGVFQINDNASTARRELTVTGNLTVDATGEIAVGTGNTNQASIDTPPFKNYYDQVSHRVIIYGDFTNSGKVRFTNLTFPIYNVRATNGYATVYFQGNTDNTITCDGQTDFYNLVLDKGSDQTYKLTINPSAYSNFRLFGANYAGGDQTGATPENPNIYKALWIRNGSLVLTGFTVIPSLTEGTGGGTPNGDFYIPSNGALILDNPNVIVLVTADDYKEVNAAYGVSGGTGQVNGVLNTGSLQALSILGTVQVNDGYLSTRESSGIVTWSYASGQIVINGGIVDVKQLRSGAGAGKSSFLQNGGLFILRGRFQRTPAAFTSPTDLAASSLATLNTARVVSTADGSMGTFSLTDPGNVFSMSGGTIRIYDGIGSRVFDVFSSAGNINVTGGTLELIPTTGSVLGDQATWDIASYAPLYNILIDRPSSTTTVRLSPSIVGPPAFNATSLIVKNNLTLNTAAFNANNLHVVVGGNFSVSLNSTYTTGTNWTILNGTGAQTLTVNTAAALAFNKFKIEKIAGTTLTLAGTQTNISVADSLMIVSGNLADGGKTIDFAGTIATASYLYSAGTHSGAGKIRFSDNVPQVIDGDGNGIFQNLELINTNAGSAPISLANNITINGTLTFSNDKLFDIKTYNLKMNSAASFVGTSATRYVKTAGTLGDGGITRVYSSPAAFTFPVGTTSTRHATAAYTPATLTLNGAPTAYGSISVAPVGYEHPTTTNNGRSLTYFWRVKSSGFTLGSTTLTHGYTYDQADVVTGANITEDGYIAARYNSATATWSKGTITDVDEATNLIGGVFLTNKTFIDGDYTAGDNTPTDPFGTPTTYYSRINGAAAGSGLWSDVNTWSTASHTGSVAASIPGPNDIVIIGAKDSIYLSNEVPQFPLNNNNPAATYYQLNKAWVSCALLQIEVGSALDIQNNPACTFGIVANHPNGNGNFRLTTRDAANFDLPKTYVFPAGDFTDFNVNRGTTEFYTVNPQSGTYFMLPNNVNSYGNVILTPLKGSNLILPNINYLTIYGDLVCKGSDADAWLAMTWNGAYGAIVQKTVYVKGNFDIDGGSFGFIYNGATLQNIIVDGNVTVAPKAGIDVWATSTNNKMSIGGNLINNSDNSTAPQGTPSIARFSNIDLTFFGPNIASVTNTVAGTPTTTFNKVTINKGSSQATTLTVNIGGTLNTPTDNWLTLQNGTLRYMRTNPNSDFTISQGTAFTIPSSAGLYVDYANSGNRNILIANAASGTNDLFLNGKLTLIRGNIYVGQIAAPNNDNDIEYSGGGASAIEVQGGQLVVNGQIRRNLASIVGVLSYSQSGGTVTINGNNSSAIRAKLEVCNPYSSFTMSNGTLNIVRGGGSTFGDLYLRPASSSITGGTIVFSQTPSVGPVVDLPQTYTLESNVALNNLTITGKAAATARTATVTLSVSPLTVNGNLTLNAPSIFNTNNRDVTIKGNMANNGGTYNAGTNTTYFTGVTQSITGITPTFNNLTVTSTASLTAIANNFTVNGNLSISNGNLVLSNRLLTLKGNLAVNSAYTDDNINGSGVSLQGTSEQQISGFGQFGRLELKNITGAKLLNDISLQNNLILTQGVLNIKQYGLTMGQTSTFTGSAPFGLTNMIITDGVTSSVGIQKYFSAGANTFVYPIGVTGKYTPATLTITANSTVGYVAINPVNVSHPLAVDPANVLKYYWKIGSSGISNFVGTLLTNYSPGDVAGIESDYVAANLLLPGTYWSKATTGPFTDRVNETIHQITFPIVATNNITGEYTAGIDAALPDEVATYRSNKDGVWTDGTIWDPVGSSPPCPAGGPSGVGVIVDHEVSITSNYASAYSTTINGKLKVISPTFGHNLGNVDGSGTLYLESGNLPAGNYDAVATCESDATIEFGGSGTYTLASTPYNEIPNMFFTGSGTRVLSNKDITICHRLVIDGPTLDNSVSNRKLTILGTMERYNTGAFKAGSGANATVTFAGAAPQTVGGPLGNFNNVNGFYNLEINNSNGINIGLNGKIEVYGNLYLTNGLINTTTNNTLVIINTSPGCVTPVGGSNTSYINGPLIKYIAAGSNFYYPIGKGISKAHSFQLISSSPLLFWTVEYFTPNTTANALTVPLVASNTEEYWKVKVNSGSYDAKVRIGWDGSSDLTPAMTTNGIVDMRVAEYNTGTSKWEELASTTSGNAALGDVATTNNVSIPAVGKNYTTASVTTTKPLAALNPTGAVCGAAGIPVKFTSFNPITLPYSLDYTLDGVAQTTITVNSLPYTLPTPAAGTYQLTGFKYNGATISGVVSSTSVTAYATPTTANAGPDQAACGITTFTLAANSPVAPSTALWSIVSGTGGNIITPTSPTSDFIGGAGKSYILRWTISNGGCKSTDDVAIGFPVAPQRPSNFTAAPKTVCQNSNNVYTVPSVPATTYNWSYSGTGASIGGTPLNATPITGLSNSVTINFNATATGGTISVTATNACGTSAARTVAITVLPLPDAAGTITGVTPICQGTNGVAFSVGAITNATGYTWTLPSGASIASGANTNSITVDFSAGAVSGNVTVMGTNACGNGVVSPNFAVVVNNPPTIALTNANPIVCAGITIASITYGVTTNSPNLYSIDFDAIAQGQGFRDTSNVTLSSPINFKVPAAPAAGTYNANLTVTNSTTGCVSQSYPITITVNASPIASWTSPLIHSVCALQTGTAFEVTSLANCSYAWTVESGVGVVNGSGNSVTVDWADNAAIFTGIVTNVDKKVSVVITNTITGCSKTLEQTITIHRLPETGPQYHVPNTFAQ